MSFNHPQGILRPLAITWKGKATPTRFGMTTLFPSRLRCGESTPTIMLCSFLSLRWSGLCKLYGCGIQDSYANIVTQVESSSSERSFGEIRMANVRKWR